MREALFGVLDSAGAVSGARVLDLYAGTGALGLEALSRGAAQATLVERAPEALRVLRANVGALGVEAHTHIVAADVARAGQRLLRLGPFDLALADPPWALFDSGEAPRAIARIVQAGVLSEQALVIVEHAARTQPPDIAGLAPVESRRYGDTALAIYKPAILGSPRPEGASTTSG